LKSPNFITAGQRSATCGIETRLCALPENKQKQSINLLIVDKQLNLYSKKKIYETLFEKY
jgi:hypothetical protein